MVRAPNQGARPILLASREREGDAGRTVSAASEDGGSGTYFAPVAFAYLRRNLSTRPAVSTIFCFPV